MPVENAKCYKNIVTHIQLTCVFVLEPQITVYATTEQREWNSNQLVPFLPRWHLSRLITFSRIVDLSKMINSNPLSIGNLFNDTF